MFEVYVKQAAVENAERYFSELASSHLEGMGLLLGVQCQYNAKNFLIITEFLTSETQSSSVSVKFSRHAFQQLSFKLSALGDGVVVGWCHSHPSYGCFLSSTDVSTQKRFFNEDFHVAAVFDPKRVERFGQKTVMAKRFYRLNHNGYKEVSFAVIK